MARPPSPGRGVIEWLKTRYQEGAVFPDSPAVRDAVRTAGLDPRCTTAQAVDWDRQARYELARGMFYVTQPRAKTRYVRNPNAVVQDREQSQWSAQKELLTRSRRQLVYANAAAAQVDASPNEIRRATRLEIATQILTDAVEGAI